MDSADGVGTAEKMRFSLASGANPFLSRAKDFAEYIDVNYGRVKLIKTPTNTLLVGICTGVGERIPTCQNKLLAG